MQVLDVFFKVNSLSPFCCELFCLSHLDEISGRQMGSQQSKAAPGHSAVLDACVKVPLQGGSFKEFP
jgi:hypothetical protein